MSYYFKVCICSIVAMIFESCDVDPRSGNVLTSPEFTLQSDQELTFAMLSPLSGNRRSLAVYETSVTRHPTTLLGTYSPPANFSEANSTDYSANDIITYSTNGTNSSSIPFYTPSPPPPLSSSPSVYGDVTATICLPAGTYQLVFIATDATNVTESEVAVMDVSLTNVACTYSPPSGKQ